jgi:hypothetical protein
MTLQLPTPNMPAKPNLYCENDFNASECSGRLNLDYRTISKEKELLSLLTIGSLSYAF